MAEFAGCRIQQSRFQPAIVRKTRVLLIASATVSASRYSGFRSPGRPPGSFNGPEGIRASSALIAPAGLVGAAIGVPGQDGGPSSNLGNSAKHRPPKFASSVIRLGESAAIGQSPRGVFFDRTVLFPPNFPQSIAGRLPKGRHDRDRALDCPVLMARHAWPAAREVGI
jgi:hypothetical protein